MKLVRDRIPRAGRQRPARHPPPGRLGLVRPPAARQAPGGSPRGHHATSPAELGDVLQILYALAVHAGLEPAAIEAARAHKACTHGTYTHRILWQRSTQEAMT